MTARARLVLIIVGVLVVCALFYFFAIRSRQSELGDVRTQVEDEENRTQQLQAELDRLEQLQENAPRLEAQLSAIREKVPESNEVPNFIFQVQQAASQAGVRFVQITPELPKQPPEGAQLAEVRSTVSAKGSYFSMQDFVRRLYDLDRAARIDNLTLGVDEAAAEEETAGPSEELLLTTTTRVFFELPAGAPAGTTTTTTTTATAPASPAPATSP